MKEEVLVWILCVVLAVAILSLVAMRIFTKETCSLCGERTRDALVIHGSNGVRFNACEKCAYEALMRRLK